MHMVQSRNAAVNIPENSTAPFFFVLPQVRAVRALRKNFIIEKPKARRKDAVLITKRIMYCVLFYL